MENQNHIMLQTKMLIKLRYTVTYKTDIKEQRLIPWYDTDEEQSIPFVVTNVCWHLLTACGTKRNTQ